jgi:protocatechuate 3,4-dioxygenase beta subunit
MTTFAPIYYLNQALKFAGFTNTYNGSSWTVNGTAASQTGTLSSITVANESNGTGSVNSPAVALNGATMSLSTTLTDASGNPLPNTAVSFNVSEYNNYPGQLPTVANVSGTMIAGTKQSNYEQYTVYTGSNGVATITMAGPAGQTFGYEVQAVAPYVNGQSTAISSQPVYAEFVANNQVGLTPGTSGTFSAALNSQVPITVTLPPNASGQTQTNVLITLNATGGNGGNPQFVSSTGASLGNSVQVATDSSGIAQAFLTDATQETVTVKATLPPSIGLANPTNASISFGQTGVPAQILNYSVSAANDTAQTGQNIVISGQAVDAQGNPVPNGQMLVTAPNGDSHNGFSYVSGTTTTAFPLVVSSSVVAGTPATSAVGDLVTANSAGNFSFALTDANADSNEAYYIWPVSNGQVTNTTQLNSGNDTVSFNASTTLAILSIGGIDGVVQGNSNTTVTGLTAATNAGGVSPAIGTDTGSNPQISDVYVEPQNSAGHHATTALNNTQLTYNLSATNGGLIYSINGTTLNSPVGNVTLTYNATTGAKAFTANGQYIASLASNTVLPGASGANQDDFEVGVTNANEGATTFTVTSGGVTSTAAIAFGGQSPDQVGNLSPGSAAVNLGGQQTVTFQLQDVNGNPVPNTSTIITDDQSANDPFWITQVNGATLQGSLNMGSGSSVSYSSQATPIPLGIISTVAPGLNYNVSVPGVALWNYNTNPNQITVYSNAQGNVNLTLQAGELTYPIVGNGSTAGSVVNAQLPTTTSWTGVSPAVGFYTNTNVSTTSGTTVPLAVYTAPVNSNVVSSLPSTISSPSTPSASGLGTGGGTLQGEVSW